ncbi:hypothetical protein QVD17_18606 [Tagetes erecta]|uniref:Uncharacterized protein n=1 Tax=Tagetes erecta TaxID=13708 RepID=A0AAD8KKU4_TARER|nr:hypothetical protein QVD17_18606 [Tagetes erecta]
MTNAMTQSSSPEFHVSSPHSSTFIFFVVGCGQQPDLFYPSIISLSCWFLETTLSLSLLHISIYIRIHLLCYLLTKKTDQHKNNQI